MNHHMDSETLFPGVALVTGAAGTGQLPTIHLHHSLLSNAPQELEQQQQKHLQKQDVKALQ